MQSTEQHPNYTSTQVPQLATDVVTNNFGTPNSDLSSTALQTRSPPAPEQRKASHGAPHALNPRSCVTCRRRKVKCDKQVPCSNCTKAGSECVFPAPGRAPRKPRQGGPVKVTSDREAELLKRLRRLEGVVEELSGQVELEAIKHSPSSENSGGVQKDGESTDQSSTKAYNVRVRGMDEGTRRGWIAKNFRIGLGPPKTAFNVETATDGIGRLVLDEGKSRYVASPFWASITEEVEEIKGMMEEEDWDDSDSDGPAMPSAVVTDADHQSFLMGYSSSEVNLKALHPLPGQIPFYWQTFLENVHPLTMLVHAPTMNTTIKEVRTNLDSLSPSTEALMFSIYFATIVSMSAEEVRTSLGVEKDDLLKQYRFGTEQALARAKFLNTKEIVTLQAFILFLVCVRRHDDTQFVWSLTGLALRLAQSLGLHRDGTRLGLHPFDTEMRRRVWWQICILDLRAADDHGSDPLVMDFLCDTEYPLNINEEDISPDKDSVPVVRTGATDITFLLIRCEICYLMKRLLTNPPGSYRQEGPPLLSLEEKEALVREVSIRLEDKYLKVCENAGPLFWVAATVTRLILTKMRLLIYHHLIQPGRQNDLPQELRDALFLSSIEMIEYSRALEAEATTKQWGWLFHTYIQWHALAYLLGELAEREASPTVDRAWQCLRGIFDPWGGDQKALHKQEMLFQPLRRLMAKARKKREENRLKEQAALPLGLETKRHTSQSFDYSDINIQQSNSVPQMPLLGHANGFTNFSPETNNSPMAMFPDHSTTIQPQALTTGMISPQQPTLPFEQPQTGVEDMFLGMDLDFTGLENADVNWNGWDDMVRDFQLDADTKPRDSDVGRGPKIGGMGNWW